MKYTHKNTCSGEEKAQLKKEVKQEEIVVKVPKPERVHDIEEVPTKQPKLVTGSYKIGDLVDKQRSESKSEGLFQGLKREGFGELKYNMFLEFQNRNN